MNDPAIPSEPPRDTDSVQARRRRPGAVLLLLALAMGALYVLGLGDHSAPAGWLTDLDQARQVARDRHRRVFVEFGAAWCPACRQMQAEVFSLPRVQAALERFVRVHIDVDAQPVPAREYHVEALPTLLVLSPDGAVQARWEGTLPPDRFVDFLAKAAPPE